MKTARDYLTISGSRQRSNLRRLNWVVVLLCLLTIFVVGVYRYRPRNSAACHIFFSDGCSKYDQVLTVPSRVLTDDEIASQVVVTEILMSYPVVVHFEAAACYNRCGRQSLLQEVSASLQGMDEYLENQIEQFVFTYEYSVNDLGFLEFNSQAWTEAIATPMSIISRHFSMSEFEKLLFSLLQFYDWFGNLLCLYYFLQMVDPGGIANWSVTYVDWSEGKWHPKSYRPHDVTNELVKNITALDYSP